MTTYSTVGSALADPNSHIAKMVDRGQSVMSENEKVIQQWMATGLTREQAWAKALAR